MAFDEIFWYEPLNISSITSRRTTKPHNIISAQAQSTIVIVKSNAQLSNFIVDTRITYTIVEMGKNIIFIIDHVWTYVRKYVLPVYIVVHYARCANNIDRGTRSGGPGVGQKTEDIFHPAKF